MRVPRQQVKFLELAQRKRREKHEHRRLRVRVRGRQEPLGLLEADILPLGFHRFAGSTQGREHDPDRQFVLALHRTDTPIPMTGGSDSQVLRSRTWISPAILRRRPDSPLTPS